MAGFCSKCGAYVPREIVHRCPPTWRVWRADETEEDGRTVYAHDAEGAAAKWAETEDAEDAVSAICSGGNDAVWVAPRNDLSEVRKFIVSGELVPSYSAKECK